MSDTTLEIQPAERELAALIDKLPGTMRIEMRELFERTQQNFHDNGWDARASAENALAVVQRRLREMQK